MVSSRLGSFGPSFRRTPVVFGTLLFLFVVYVVTGLLVQFSAGFGEIYGRLVLTTPDVLRGEVWRLLTYAMLHSLADPFHLVMNGLVLFWFGRDLEVLWGRGRFIGFLFGAVLAGALMVVLSGVLGIGSGSALGFSAATEAAIVAWAFMNRHRVVQFFMFPPFKGIWVIALAVVNWVLDAVSMSPSSASAHLGGIVFGLLVGLDLGDRVRLWRRRRKQPRFTVVPKLGKDGDRWVN